MAIDKDYEAEDTTVPTSTRTAIAKNVGEEEAVKVHFDPNAPVTGSADATVSLDVVKVEMKHPTGDPEIPGEANSFNEIFFWGNTPGVLTLYCDAFDSGGDNENLTWWCNHGMSANQQWTPARFSGNDTWGKGLSPKAEWNGLPTMNSAFGKWTVYLYYELPPYGDGNDVIDETSTTIEVFYMANKKNHPGTNQGTTANWYYYFQQTGAGNSLATYKNPLYDEEGEEAAGITNVDRNWITYNITGAPGYGYPDHVLVSDKALKLTTAGHYNDGPDIESAIDSYRATLAHELKHRQDFRDGINKNDKDGDCIADCLEDTNGNGQWDPGIDESNFEDSHSILNSLTSAQRNKLQDDPDYYDDAEWRAFTVSENLIKNHAGEYDNKDWTAAGINANYSP